MDKYQEAVLKQIGFDLRTVNNEMGSVKLSDNKLEIIQNENYHLEEYKLSVLKCGVSKLALDDECANGNSIKISFSHKAKALTIFLENNIVKPIKLKLSYIESEKEVYDNKVHEEECNNYIEKASIKAAVGPSLINIYFQPCCEKCNYTRIKLYTAKGKFDSGLHGGCCAVPPGWQPTLVGGEVEQMIGNYKVEEGAMFKAIKDLANGVYAYQVSQYDKDDNQLFESKPTFIRLN